MSWVISSMPRPRARWRPPSRARISACVETSSAVVGSSHSSSRGSPASAPAIMTRCSMPPESWCGYCRRWRGGSGRPTAASSSSARASASRRDQPLVSRSGSVRKSPMRRTGLMPARGSWKTIDATPVRTSRSRAASAPTRSLPSTRTRPVTRAFAGRRPSAERAVTDLPEPDSPTRPTTSPAATRKLTASSTGRAAPGSSTVSASISRSVIGHPSGRGGRRAVRRRR